MPAERSPAETAAPPPLVVQLSAYEVRMAAAIGVERQLESISRGLKDAAGLRDSAGWSEHISGCLGELAVCKALGWHWSATVNTFKNGADIRDRIEVRTRSRHSYELIIRPDDAPNKFYVLVTGRASEFWVRGWILGAQARRDEWWHGHGGRDHAWFVPHSALNPMPDKYRLKSNAYA